MPMFHYEATDRRGKAVVGSMDARDEGAVRARLIQGGYTPVLIETAGASSGRGAGPSPGASNFSGYGAAGPSAGPSGAPPTPRMMGAGGGYAGGTGGTGAGNGPGNGPGATYGQSMGSSYSAAGAAYSTGVKTETARRVGTNVSNRTLAQFYRQMSAATRSGVPLTQILPGIKAQTRDRTMRAALEDVEATVSRGRPISEAMERHPRAFSAGQVGLIKAGEGAGFLDRAFEELAVQSEADWGVEAATRFNIILFIMKWGAVPFMAGWLYFMVVFVPTMQNYKGTGDVISGVFHIGMQALGVAIAAMLILNVFLPVGWKGLKGTRFGDVWSNLGAALPMVGARQRRTDAVKTLSSLSSAMSAGVPPTIAWKLAAEAADTPHFRNGMERQWSLVRQGIPIPEALAATNLFDANTLNMIRSGEMSGNMPEMLQQAVFYAREEAKHIGNLTPWVIALLVYFLLLLIGAAMFIYFTSKVYGGSIDRALNF